MSGEHAADVPDQALRSALEFAVGIAAAGAKLRPPMSFPVELRRFLRFHKLPPAALSQVREAVEGDEEFRLRLASVASEELVDPIGMLWLSRPEGWNETIVEALPEKVVDHQTAMRRAERRRQAAEESATRAKAEVLNLGGELERERTAKTAMIADIDRLHAEVDDLRQRLREAQRSEHATAQALAKVEAELIEVRRAHDETQSSATPPPSPVVDTAIVRALLDAAATSSSEVVRLLTAALAEVDPGDGARLAEHAAPARHGRPTRRVPIRLPGGVLSGSVESAEFLLRTAGGQVLIDGYNVAKLGWPSLDLDHQREQCTTATENLAKRWNIAMTIVFDGATIQGAHASARRRVRLIYSPEGVTADDVLRAELAASRREQPVIVVTNDRAIISDVVAAGANTVSSDAFLALTRH